MKRDPFAFISALEKKSPRLARSAAMWALAFMSPFNARLKACLLEWTDRKCLIGVRRIRAVRNHVGSIHAGALFTLGETCAGLVIIRNFPFSGYRPLMSDVQVNYSRQARSDVTGECVMTDDMLADMRAVLEKGEVPSVRLVTNIYDDKKEIVAVVSTQWQVKPWNLVTLK